MPNRKHVKTLNSNLSSAEICRRNGWGPGTILSGNEGHGDTDLLITAVGTFWVLAVTIRHADETFDHNEECLWKLTMRDWKKIRFIRAWRRWGRE